jgi:hypothetical protein
MNPDGEPRSEQLFEWLRHAIVIGRRYEMFAREHPSTAATRIAELNAPGRDGNAWDLHWVPSVLRPRIARSASAVVLHFCRLSDDTENSALMDILMPTAVVAACVVAHTYGIPVDIPPDPLPNGLGRWARLLSTVLKFPREADEPILGLGRVESDIVSRLPPSVRSQLCRLAALMSHDGWSMKSPIPTVIVLIGTVATDAFETLDLPGIGAQE